MILLFLASMSLPTCPLSESLSIVMWCSVLIWGWWQQIQVWTLRSLKIPLIHCETVACQRTSAEQTVFHMWPKTHLHSHSKKNVVTCIAHHLRMWYEWSDPSTHWECITVHADLYADHLWSDHSGRVLKPVLSGVDSDSFRVTQPLKCSKAAVTSANVFEWSVKHVKCQRIHWCEKNRVDTVTQSADWWTLRKLYIHTHYINIVQ